MANSNSALHCPKTLQTVLISEASVLSSLANLSESKFSLSLFVKIIETHIDELVEKLDQLTNVNEMESVKNLVICMKVDLLKKIIDHLYHNDSINSYQARIIVNAGFDFLKNQLITSSEKYQNSRQDTPSTKNTLSC